jgi:hypothetical protein
MAGHFGSDHIIGTRGTRGAVGGAQRFHAPCAIVTLLALGGALAWACLHRGPWYDEFYTQFVSRPGLSWGAALRGSWLADNHPPLYYVLARLSDWLGPVAPHRLLNLALGLLAAAGAVVVVADVPRLAPAGAALAFALAANRWTFIAASELRSYFLSLCAITLLALALCAIRLSGDGGTRGRRAVYTLAALVAFNTHIVTSLTAAALVAPFLIEALARRDWAMARATGAAPLAAGLIFTGVSAIQLPMWLANTQVFWIAPGFSSGRWALEWALLHTLGASVPVLLGALGGLALMLGDGLARRRAAPETGPCALLGAGVAMAVLGLLALHMARPLLIEKYLTGLMGAVCVLLALACGRLLRGLGPRMGAAVLAAMLLVTLAQLPGNVALAVARPSWLGTGRAIAAQVAQCPGTIVHTDPRWNEAVIQSLPRDNGLAVPFAYRTTAAMLGFALAPAGSHAVARACPTIFWGEHDSARRFDAATITAQLRASGFPVAGLAFQRIGDGWLALVPPPRSGAAAP